MYRVSFVVLLGTLLFTVNACATQPHPSSPSATEPTMPTHATFAGQPISLSDSEGRCALTYGNRPALIMDMQWPCRFSEDLQKNLRVEYFEQTPILMVERSEHLPAPSKGCKTDRQPVRLHHDRLEPAMVGRIAACGPAQWDQKAFIGMFDW